MAVESPVISSEILASEVSRPEVDVCSFEGDRTYLNESDAPFFSERVQRRTGTLSSDP